MNFRIGLSLPTEEPARILTETVLTTLGCRELTYRVFLSMKVEYWFITLCQSIPWMYIVLAPNGLRDTLSSTVRIQIQAMIITYSSHRAHTITPGTLPVLCRSHRSVPWKAPHQHHLQSQVHLFTAHPLSLPSPSRTRVVSVLCTATCVRAWLGAETQTAAQEMRRSPRWLGLASPRSRFWDRDLSTCSCPGSRCQETPAEAQGSKTVAMLSSWYPRGTGSWTHED